MEPGPHNLYSEIRQYLQHPFVWTKILGFTSTYVENKDVVVDQTSIFSAFVLTSHSQKRAGVPFFKVLAR